MTTTVTETGPFERLVKFQLTDEQINEAKKAAARKLAGEVRIHGFRPGKAPLPIVEATVGADRVRQEAIDDLLNPTLTNVLEAEEIRPAINPELSSMDDVEGGVQVEVKVTLWPKIDLPTYRDRRIEVTNPEVRDEDLDTQIERMLEQFATVEEVERPAGDGDFVSIDIEASSEGEPVEETKATDLLYEVGSGLFIEGMDDHVRGASARDEIVFDAPLPQGFGERAGEVVTFRVAVNEVKERVLPDLDDDFVDENTEFETVQEFKEALRDQLADAKLRAVSREFAEKALSTLREQVDVEIPEGLIRAEMDGHLHDFLHRLEDAELSLQDYFGATGLSQEEFLNDLRNQADRSIRTRLVLEAVVEAEGLEISEDEIDAALRSLAARTEKPDAYLKALRDSGQELAVASDILRNRALGVIMSNATPVDEDGNEIDLSSQAPQVEAEVVEDAVEAEVVEAEVLEEEE